MVQFNFNAQNIAPNIALEPLPSGNYLVQIIDSNQKPNSKGTGWYIEFKMEVLDGPYKSRNLYDRLNLSNPSDVAVSIAQATLSALCNVTGRMVINDTRELHGIPITAVVRKIERNDMPGSGVMTNDVMGYKDRNGQDPTAGNAGTVAQPSAQPAWAGQQYAPTPAPEQPAPYQPPQQAPYPAAPPPPPVTYPQAAPQAPQQYAQIPPAAPAQPAPAPYPPNGQPAQQPAPQAPAPAATPYPTQASGPPPWVQQ